MLLVKVAFKVYSLTALATPFMLAYLSGTKQAILWGTKRILPAGIKGNEPYILEQGHQYVFTW